MSAPEHKNSDYVEIENADAIYEPIVDFASWQALSIDEDRWDAHQQLLLSHGEQTPDLLARAREAAKRAAAIDTGAIEGLYDLDRGITITIATQSAMWEAAFQNEETRVQALIECQLDAYDFVIDFATKRVPIVEAWIRTLHERLCGAQKTYKALTTAGFQDQPLSHGAYKTFPNHVKSKEGAIHSYAPVAQTQPEMHRLCQELRTEAFQNAHPVRQAAYVHHAFTKIHPFQDGNGRVARAFASVFTYRAASIPLLVLVEHRDAYFDALAKADAGDYQAFVNFVFVRSLDAFLLVNESLKAALVPSPTVGVKQLNSLFYTKGGYTHHEVDVAGQSLLSMFQTEISLQGGPLQVPNQLQIHYSRMGQQGSSAPTGYRNLVSLPNEVLRVAYVVTGQVAVTMNRNFCVHVPQDCDTHDSLILRCVENVRELKVPMPNLASKRNTVTALQVSMFVQQVLGSNMKELQQIVVAQLREKGI